MTAAKNISNNSGDSTHLWRRPWQTLNHAKKSPPFSCTRARIPIVEYADDLDHHRQNSKAGNIFHSSTQSTKSYPFARLINKAFIEVLLVRRNPCSLRTTNLISVVQRWGRKPHCSSGRIPAFSQKSQRQLDTILRRTLPVCATRVYLFLCRTVMVMSFTSRGTSYVIYTAMIMP